MSMLTYIYISTWMSVDSHHLQHIDLCAIEYSFGDARIALKHGDEACLHIWHLTWNLYIVSPNLSCKLLTDKMNLLKKCFSAIWFLTISGIWTMYNIVFTMYNIKKMGDRIYVEARYFIFHIWMAHPDVG